MDKYKKQAPRDKYRYRPRRATCCYSRVGTVKVSFHRKEQVEEKGLEAYRCQVHPERWHGRTKR